MSKGKYSPTIYNKIQKGVEFDRNCFGKIPEEYYFEMSIESYNEQTMFADYDSEGFDRYGYSAFDSEGKYVGIGNGVDRNGYTEHEYLAMSDQEFEDHC